MACMAPLSQTRVVLTLSEACERNKGPILAVLREVLAGSTQVLEVGSGTGQHAVYFAAGLPQLLWQPSELAENLPPLAERIRLEGTANLRAPLALDVRDEPWPVTAVDAAKELTYGAPPHDVQRVGAEHGVGGVLVPSGVLCVYGPFRFGGRHTSDSNAAFDHYLRARDPESGVRDFEALDAEARARGLRFAANHAMPANNRTLVWRHSPREA